MTIVLAGGVHRLQAAVAARLVERAHQVRVLCSTTRDPLRPWPAGVEPRVIAADDMAAAEAAARGCTAAVVVEPRVDQAAGQPRSLLYEPTNSTIAALARAGVQRLILVRASKTIQAVPFSGDRLVIEAAPVYGTRDDPVSRLLVMMRSLPAVPLLNDEHLTRPLWYDDLAQVVAVAMARADAAIPQPVVLGGPDAVTMAQLYERIAVLIDRRPVRIPVPDFVARHGAHLAEALHLPVPFTAAHLGLDSAHEGAAPLSPDAFGVPPTRLDAGLRRIVNELDELTPLDGIGRVEVKRFHALIEGARYTAAELLRQFRLRFRDVMPIGVGVEPASADALLSEGDTVALALPGRGHVQVRVEQIADDHVLVSTLRGHALAGFVRFRAQPAGDARVRFEVTTCDAAANALDWLTLTLGGARIQDANWTKVVQNVVELSGGFAGDVQMDARPLPDDEAEAIDRWVRAVIRRRQSAGPERAGRIS